MVDGLLRQKDNTKVVEVLPEAEASLLVEMVKVAEHHPTHQAEVDQAKVTPECHRSKTGRQL